MDHIAGIAGLAGLARRTLARSALVGGLALAVVLASGLLPGGGLRDPARAETAASAAPAEAAPANADVLIPALRLDSVAIGYAATPGGRVFLPLSRLDGSVGPQVVEWAGGAPRPFPDAAWNGREGDPDHRFVGVSALRIGPRGDLWVVDTGAATLTGPKPEHGAKLIRIDLAADTVARVYPLDEATKPKSRIDDIRFHGGLAYLTDAGSPGVVILDLATGSMRRVLDDDPSLTAQRAITVDDHVLRGPDGAPFSIHADQLEVSPDGKFFYYQPASGPISRLATRYLDNPKLSTPQLAKNITTFAKVGSTGGSAIDAEGNIYCSNTDKHTITVINPDGRQRQLIQDPRLHWVDAMWIDDAGWLYMPAAQLDRMAPFNKGVSKLELPITVWKMKIGAKPAPGDHP